MAPDIQLETTLGTITIELYAAHAPKTTDNFRQLVQRGYYDGTPFHRVIRDFMVQGGDPTGTGRGGESCWGGTFADEIDPALKHYGRRHPEHGQRKFGATTRTAASSSSRWRRRRGSTASTPSSGASRRA